MPENLRKVVFSLGYPEFYPDATDLQEKEQEEKSRKREGYFHCWIQDEECSAQSGHFREKTVGLIEEIATGKLYHVDTDLISFK